MKPTAREGGREDQGLTQRHAPPGIAARQESKPGAIGTNIICQEGSGIET